MILKIRKYTLTMVPFLRIMYQTLPIFFLVLLGVCLIFFVIFSLSFMVATYVMTQPDFPIFYAPMESQLNGFREQLQANWETFFSSVYK